MVDTYHCTDQGTIRTAHASASPYRLWARQSGTGWSKYFGYQSGTDWKFTNWRGYGRADMAHQKDQAGTLTTWWQAATWDCQ